MEKVQLQLWWRAGKSRLSYKNATIVLCLINAMTTLFLISAFFHSTSREALIKESEVARRSMIPVDLIKRIREIRDEVYVEEVETVQTKEVKQSNAGNLISRLNNFHSYSDAGNIRGDSGFFITISTIFSSCHLSKTSAALEEWRKRKIERARQRSLARNGTTSPKS